MANVIREHVAEGVTYAVLHGSVHDRSKARQFKVTTVPPEGGYVEGHLDGSAGTVAVDVRLLRASWDDWVSGKVRPRSEYRRKKPEEWLRRLCRDQDASDELRQAAMNQLASLGASVSGSATLGVSP